MEKKRKRGDIRALFFHLYYYRHIWQALGYFPSRDWNEVLQLPFEWLVSNCHLFSCNFHLNNEREDEEDKSRNFFTGSLRKKVQLESL